MPAQLWAETREETGKESAKKFRRQGKIPSVLYGHGFQPIPISLEDRAFKALLRHEKGLHGLVELNIAGREDGKHTVVVKEIQRHPLKDEILHVDFQKIRSDEELTAEVPLQFSGEAAGVKAGGIMQHYIYELTVQCLPLDLPEVIEVDVSGLQLKENLRVQDLPKIKGVRYLNNPEEIVAAVTPKRVREAGRLPGEEGFEEGVEEVAGEAAAEPQASASEESA
jgi:large subunit ribosomal protein L25